MWKLGCVILAHMDFGYINRSAALLSSAGQLAIKVCPHLKSSINFPTLIYIRVTDDPADFGE